MCRPLSDFNETFHRRGAELLAGVVTALIIVSWSQGRGVADDATAVSFEQHVRPVLKVHCFHCHGEQQELSGGLDLRLVRLMLDGGDSGAAIVRGDPDDSVLWQRIAADEMPEGPKKLTAEQKLVIQTWIEQGARTLRPEPTDVREARYSFEELSHWAYQPVNAPDMPRLSGYDLRTPVDAFVAQRLAEHGLTFSPEAERTVLIRRVTFSLLGLPPTPDQVAEFLADTAPGAYERLVDRLLASPQYGVRWGRHWLDVAGYAETNGGQDTDTKREAAWRYRDYVVDAFNQSKPIDRFYVEQLAGDELVGTAIDLCDPRHLEWLTATGFLRMAPDPTQTNNSLADRNMAVADALKVVSSAMLGLTVGCAQCHDHKYDPIASEDYYRFRAIFDPAFPLQAWQPPAERLVDFTSAEVNAKRAEIEAAAKALEDDLIRRRNELAQQIQQRKLADVPETVRDATREAVLAEPSQRTEEQQRLLDLYPMVKPVSYIVGLLIEYDMPAYRQFEQELEQITALRATKPPQRLVAATRERPDVVPTSHVLFRGDPESPGDPVLPGELMVLRRNRDVQVPDNHPSRPTTGRRLAYARQLTDGTHPLAARVFVNRVWLNHFGRGLVVTPGDFGLAGEKPTHPELLDWLASDFVRHGWDLKRLHRLLLTSRTYRQSSRRTAQLETLDPENELWGRMNLRRLEAEPIRDAILAAIGDLNQQLGGPSIPVTESPEGKVVIGRPTVRDGLKTGVDGAAAQAGRRSIYIEVQRRLPLNMLATFGQPEMNPNCDLRKPSIDPTQALWFMNDALIIDQSEGLARRLFETASTSEEQIEQLFIRLFSQPPTAEERQDCLEYLALQSELVRARFDELQPQTQVDAANIPLQAMATLCQALLSSNRFLYVD